MSLQDSFSRPARAIAIGLAALALMVTAAPAHAEMPGDVPERFRFEVGGYAVDAFTEGSLSSSTAGIGATVNFEDIFDLPSNTQVLSFAGTWKVAKRQYIDFGYVQIRRVGSKEIDEDVDWGDFVFQTGAEVGALFDTSFPYAAWRYGASLAALGAMAFGWSLLALTVIDLDTQLLPDDITLPLLWAGLLLNLGGVFATLASAVVGAAAGYLALWSVYWAFKLATGKEGMGYGDFKLLAAIGAWLGWQKLPMVILLSSVVGAVVGIGLMVFARHAREKPIPFGPYLAAAGLIAMLWGDTIARRWLPILS